MKNKRDLSLAIALAVVAVVLGYLVICERPWKIPAYTYIFLMGYVLAATVSISLFISYWRKEDD